MASCSPESVLPVMSKRYVPLPNDTSATKSAVDPRLTVRYKLGSRDLPDVRPDSDDSAVWLKGSAGIYHQPPRFVLPLPGEPKSKICGTSRSFSTDFNWPSGLSFHWKMSRRY